MKTASMFTALILGIALPTQNAPADTAPVAQDAHDDTAPFAQDEPTDADPSSPRTRTTKRT